MSRTKSVPCGFSLSSSPLMSQETLECSPGQKYRRPTLVTSKHETWDVRGLDGVTKTYHRHKKQWARKGGCYTYNSVWNDAVKLQVKSMNQNKDRLDPDVILANAVDASKRLSPTYVSQASPKYQRAALLRKYRKRQQRQQGLGQGQQGLGQPENERHFYYF